MQSVGTRLREAREKRGYSLDDINARTRINCKNLVAIETDEVRDVSSPFFYRSFVRQYAETVGVDFITLASQVESLAGNMPQPHLPGQGEHQVVRVAPIHARVKRDWSWVVPTAVMIGIVAVGSSGYTYLKVYKPSFLQYSTVSSLFSKPGEAKPAAAAPVQAAAKIENPAPDAAATMPDRIHLELDATERTWLSVSADGKPAYTGILEPAQKKVLEGQDSARLRTGNAGGVSIVFNGKSIGTIGPRGKTRTVVFSKTGYEIESAEGATLIQTSHVGG